MKHGRRRGVLEAQLFGCLCRLHDLEQRSVPGEPEWSEARRLVLEADIRTLGGDPEEIRVKVERMYADRLALARRRAS